MAEVGLPDPSAGINPHYEKNEDHRIAEKLIFIQL
jgi:hypothetical protein